MTPLYSVKSGSAHGAADEIRERWGHHMGRDFADAHTHMFNIRHIPVSEVLYSLLKQKIGIGGFALAPVCDLIQRVLVGLSFLSGAQIRSLMDEYSELDRDGGLHETTLDSIVLTVSAAFAEIEEGAAHLGIQDVGEVTAFTERTAAPLRLIGNSSIRISDRADDHEALRKEVEAIIDALENEPSEQDVLELVPDVLASIREGLRKILKLALKILKGIDFGLEVLIQLLGSESSIFRKYLSQFGAERPFLTVNHAMDLKPAFKKWFLLNSYYDFYKAQIRELGKLIAESDGRTVSFTAFDPRRKHWKKHLKFATDQGLCGVKYYPPLGYRPSDDTRRNNEFFDYCQSLDIPVFTHCTPVGFERKSGDGLGADPKYWQKRLSKERQLRLCLGHAGGTIFDTDHIKTLGWLDPKWTEAGPDNFAKGVVALCREFENVYCEVAYLTELFDEPKHLVTFVQNLAYELDQDDKLRGSPFKLRDKIMFGTDWHMPAMIGRADDYMERLAQVVSQLATPGFEQAFFSTNLLRYLDLRSYLDRSSRFFSNNPGPRKYLEGLASRDLSLIPDLH